MNIYIVEDDLFHLEDLVISLEELGHSCVGNSSDPFEAQEQIGAIKPDIVLMDIHLNGKQSGIALGKRVKTLYGTPIIFTSSDKNDTIINKAADIEPAAYLVKPINKHDLQAALILAQKQLDKKEENPKGTSKTLFIKNGNKLVKVSFDTILFAHTDSKNYCSIVTSDNKKLSVRYSILNLHKLLDPTIFIQTHRSYIVNWENIDSFYESDQTIDIKGNSIPIGRTFKSAVYKKLNII